MFHPLPRLAYRSATSIGRRWGSTLPGSPHIYVFPSQSLPSGSHILSLQPAQPRRDHLAIGVTTQLPPTPDSFSESRGFRSILQEVLAEHAHRDENVKSQAQAMASQAGSPWSRGVFVPQKPNTKRKPYGEVSAEGASGQGGAGGAGVGGFVHVSDLRNPPDYGRIPFPEDIFGSLEVDGHGNFVGENGSYQPNETYRIVTREGILGLSPYLRKQLVLRLSELDSAKS
ncbi:MAG: hypothetical protein M1832_005422 [Thelocarpon impressellum]|nr:MAG: hypothetical protein M1832_005422 [Thelocarpon impressellum]